MYCNYCGKVIQDDAAVCAYCGIRVGASVSRLYFANTLGSAMACYLCAMYFLREFGQSGSVSIAACLNTFVGGVAYLYGRRPAERSAGAAVALAHTARVDSFIKLPVAMLLAALSGSIALGFEIAWFRVFAMASAAGSNSAGPYT